MEGPLKKHSPFLHSSKQNTPRPRGQGQHIREQSVPLSEPLVVHRGFGGPERPPHRDKPMGIYNESGSKRTSTKTKKGTNSFLFPILRLRRYIKK